MSDVLAIDIGYGYTKAMTPTGQVIIPSIVGPAEAIRFESDIAPENGGGIAVTVRGRRYFVGEYAELQSASANQTLDPTRTGSNEQLALFYAAASELIKTTSDSLSVVTGLPVADYNERHKSEMTRMLRGEHVINRQGKRERRFTVENVYLVPQAMGALFALVLDRRGGLIDGDLAGGRVGIVDAGMLTTNFVLVDRLRYVEMESDSMTTGMAEMLGKVARDLKKTYGLDWGEKLCKVDRAVRERTVQVYGDPVNISGLLQPHLDAIGDKVLSKAKTLWGSGVDLRAVVLTGGGSIELAPYFRREYLHVRTSGGDPQYTNVTGYLRVGLRRWGG